MTDVSPVTVLLRKEGETLAAFARRCVATHGDILAVLGPDDAKDCEDQSSFEEFLAALSPVKDRLFIATQLRKPADMARGKGFTVYHQLRPLRRLLADHPQSEEALRVFHPHAWKQAWRSRLQDMGLLSLPKFRIVFLVALSGGLLFFVVFYLLPSAEVKVWPKSDSVSQTANVLLVGSGATTGPEHLRTAQLIPFMVTVQKTLTFTDISKEYVGTNASLTVKVTNVAKEPYGFKKSTRITNQAGMVFTFLAALHVEPGESVSVKARAADTDLYGEEIGGRGNVPAGLPWEMPGLPVEERPLIKIVNTTPGKGGHSATRTVVKPEDVEKAKAQLEAELTKLAQADTEKERVALNATNSRVQFLVRNDIVKKAFTGFVIPTDQLGKAVASFPVSGTLTYTVYGFDATYILSLLTKDASERAMEGREVVESTFNPDSMRVYIVDKAPDLSWVKVTADLTVAERFVLDPLSPTGVAFGKRIRDGIKGLPIKDALRIIRNMPEVEKADVRLWPPWSGRLPAIPAHIYIVPQSS